MKLFSLTTMSLLFSLTCAAAVAAPSDVPAKHWAAGAVGRMTHEKIMSSGANGKFQGNKPVTRYELAVVLDRFVRYIEAGKKPLHPTTVKVTMTPAQRKAAPEVRAALADLASNGFIPAKSSLLVKDGSGIVTAQELANTLAQITIRLSDRTLPRNPNED